MSGALSSLEGAFSVPYEKLAGFPAARVEGHAGRLDCGAANGVPVVVFRGRFHLYEGRTPAEVAAPVRLAKALGAGVFIQASAAGGIGKGLLPGSLALVRDSRARLRWCATISTSRGATRSQASPWGSAGRLFSI
jgi:purine-nucleoside phosphorylase